MDFQWVSPQFRGTPFSRSHHLIGRSRQALNAPQDRTNGGHGVWLGSIGDDFRAGTQEDEVGGCEVANARCIPQTARFLRQLNEARFKCPHETAFGRVDSPLWPARFLLIFAVVSVALV